MGTTEYARLPRMLAACYEQGRMEANEIERALGPELWAALARKGYAQLTSVQEAVLEQEVQGRDLRITSQTGSGKTLAVGFALRSWVMTAAPPSATTAASPPRVLVVAPTRELARQTQAELQWLYADYRAQVVAITGGASFRDERRELARSPRVVVGTPGRLLDHLSRGSLDPSALAVIVLDEADRLLDLGFRDDLDAIIGHAPAEHFTHLVSATFPRAVRTLADRVQRSPAHVEGTRLGAAHADIDHVIHVIDPRQKVDAIINLLLSSPEAQTLVFARTRADVAALGRELIAAGFAAVVLSGELDQAARNRALLAFKQGRESVLVATDVAARGIDVQDVRRVIHAEPPTSADAYTHRSGRTGRAGRKGVSHLLITPAQVVPATRLLRTAAIPHHFEPIPSMASIQRASDERIFDELTRDDTTAEIPTDQARIDALARRLLGSGATERVVARLLRSRYTQKPQARDVRPIAPPPRQHADRDGRGRPSTLRSSPDARGRKAQQPHARGAAVERDQTYVPFVFSWGGRQGADPRRLLAIACRRGAIQGSDVGAIRIEAEQSIVEVASSVAARFETEAARPDPRNPRAQIRPMATQDGRKSLKRRR